MKKFFLVFVCCFPLALLAQPGSIRVKKPVPADSASPVTNRVTREPLIYIGAESMSGINRFGQVFRPRKKKIDREALGLISGTGIVIGYHRSFASLSGTSRIHLFAQTGATLFRTHDEIKSIGIPAVAGFSFGVGSFPIAPRGEIGLRTFLPRGDAQFAGKTLLETNIGFDVYIRINTKRLGPVPMSILSVDYKRIGKEQFAYGTVSFPVIWRKKWIRIPPVPPERL